MCLDFSMDNFINFRVINAYFPPEPQDRKQFIDNYSQYLIRDKMLILGGDFNFILDSNLDKTGGNLGPELFCLLLGPSGFNGFLLLQCSSGVVGYPRDLQVSIATSFCRVLIFVLS